LQFNAIKILLNHDYSKEVIGPLLDEEKLEINWDKIKPEGLSTGHRTILSWARVIWTDNCDLPKEYADPFESFSSLDLDLQKLIIQAFSIRHGFTHVLVERKKSDLEKYVE
jgi:hypothetical protein